MAESVETTPAPAPEAPLAPSPPSEATQPAAAPFTTQWLQENQSPKHIATRIAEQARLQAVGREDLKAIPLPEPTAAPFTVAFLQQRRDAEDAQAAASQDSEEWDETGWEYVEDGGEWDELESPVPDEWHERFVSLRSGYKSLESDHRDLKGEYESLAGFLDGLYGRVQDEFGNEYNTTEAFVSRLREGEPEIADQLQLDLWAARGEDGLTGAQRMFYNLGLNPAMLADYRALTQNPHGNATRAGGISPVELQYIPEQFHDTYELLSPADRYAAQLIDNPAELEHFLDDRRRSLEDRQFRARYNRYQQRAAQESWQAFQNGVERSLEEYVGQLRQDGMNSIIRNISSQITFSADKQTNAVQTAMIQSFMANLINPDLRFASVGALDAMGVTLDNDFWNSLDELTDEARAVKWYEAVAANPAYAQYRNDAALAKAQEKVNKLYKSACAKFNYVAIKLAKVLTNHNQQLREASWAEVNTSRQHARPTFSSGSLPTPTQAKPAAKPFTTEWLQQSRDGH
jgi:hypothetical protein